MYLVRMRPQQVHEAVNKGLPVVVSVGVIEYHGSHLPLGTDILIPEYVCRQIEEQCPCVIAPSVPYGPTLSWAGGAEDGEIDFASEPFYAYVKEMLSGLLKIGFSKIYVMQYHQGSEGLQALILKHAAVELLRESTQLFEPGWGRRMLTGKNANIFGRIQVAGLDAFSQYAPEEERMPIDHAGMGETQLMMHADPETVDMDLLETGAIDQPHWLKDAGFADPHEGKRWLHFCIDGWVKQLRKRSNVDKKGGL